MICGNTYYGIESFSNTGGSTLYSFELNGDKITGTASENTVDASNIDAATFVNGMLYAFDNDMDMLTTINSDGEEVGAIKVTGFDSSKKFEGLAYVVMACCMAASQKAGIAGCTAWILTIQTFWPMKLERFNWGRSHSVRLKRLHSLMMFCTGLGIKKATHSLKLTPGMEMFSESLSTGVPEMLKASLPAEAPLFPSPPQFCFSVSVFSVLQDRG